MAPLSPSPAGLARADLSSQRVLIVSILALAAVTALDLIDGRLGPLFSIGFVLIVATMPLAVEAGKLFFTGALPPLLLVLAIGVVAVVNPEAIAVEGLPANVGWAGRTLTGIVDRGVTLLVGSALALASIIARLLSDPEHRRCSGKPTQA